MLRLLEMGGFEAVAELKEDLYKGFPMVGWVHEGCGWLPRTDGRYSCPIDIEKFKDLNRAYVQRCLKRTGECIHWQDMLRELLQEVDEGKVSGPYVHPHHWPSHPAFVDGYPCLQLEYGRKFIRHQTM